MKNIDTVQDDVETASGSVDALCNLLAAANDEPVPASSLHALLKPVARVLNVVASRISDMRSSNDPNADQ